MESSQQPTRTQPSEREPLPRSGHSAFDERWRKRFEQTHDSRYETPVHPHPETELRCEVCKSLLGKCDIGGRPVVIEVKCFECGRRGRPDNGLRVFVFA